MEDIFLTKNEYLEYLNKKGISKQTATTYYNRLKFYRNNSLEGKSKEYICQTKNALKYYYKFHDIYFHKNINELSDMQKKTVKKRSAKTITKISTVNKKINAIKNKRIKLAFRLQQLAGLRIGEVSKLTKNDIEFKDGKVFVTVRDSKGGKSRKVSTILKDAWLSRELQNLEERKGIMFYSESTLRVKAWNLGFKTHKLRKVAAKTINLRYSAKSEEERKELLRKYLGHENTKTLNIYIDENDREIDLSGTKFDI